MNFSLSMAYPPLLLVLWVLGLSMVSLAALVWLPPSVVLAGSLAVIAGHNLLDPIRAADLGQFAGVWRVLHEPGVLPVGGIVAVVGYPLVPWCAVMAAGYGLGPVFAAPAAVRQRRLVTMGLACCVAFLALRLRERLRRPRALDRPAVSRADTCCRSSTRRSIRPRWRSC